MTTDTRKQAILAALRTFIAQRPGMEPGNYGSWSSYRQEYREVLRDKHDAERMLRELELRDSITADAILKEAGGGGRLTLEHRGMHDAIRGGYAEWYAVSYCTGQYFATEYRKAVARLAAAVLWAHVREHGMPVNEAGGRYETYGPKPGGGLMSAGDWLRAHFKREFGRHLAARYFD